MSLQITLLFDSSPLARGNIVSGLALVLSLCALPALPAGGVGLYEVFETQVTNSNSYNNPFDSNEIELQATFTAPSGKKIDFFGFHDGDGNGGQNGNVWRLRFMPDELGNWTYSATFSDGNPGTNGSFDVVSGTSKGPIYPSSQNPRWLMHANGEHVFPKCYLHIANFYWRDSKTFLEWKAETDSVLLSKGYNCVLGNGIPVRAGSSLWPHENIFFHAATISSLDYSKYHMPSWKLFEEQLNYLANNSVIVFFFDGFFGGNESPSIAARIPDDESYLKYVVARLGSFWNITWNIAFEWNEFLSSAQVKQYASFVKSIDPWQHMMSAHGTPGNFSFPNEPWANYANLQNKVQNGSLSELRRVNTYMQNNYFNMPVFANETLWENNSFTPNLEGDGIRRAGWAILMAGAFYAYADWQDPKGLGNGDGQPFVQLMYEFMDNLKPWMMDPHNELVSTDNFCLAAPGKEYVVYLPSGGSVDVDLTAATGSMAVEWFNPRTGTSSTGTSVSGGGTVTVTAPDANDWVLHISDGGTSPNPPTNLQVQ